MNRACPQRAGGVCGVVRAKYSAGGVRVQRVVGAVSVWVGAPAWEGSGQARGSVWGGVARRGAMPCNACRRAVAVVGACVCVVAAGHVCGSGSYMPRCGVCVRWKVVNMCERVRVMGRCAVLRCWG